MPSPFPGMNPYLEQDDAWHDFTKRFMPALAEAVMPGIREDYICQLATTIGANHQNRIEIRDRHDRQLVAVIELLSPANKRPGPNREQYLAKRRRLLASPVHLVELDLLRGGTRLPLEDLPNCDYYAMVSRVEMRPSVGLWPLTLRDPLPPVRIPMRAPDSDATVDLRMVLNRVYDAAGYEDYIYSGSPQPPLAGEDAAWAANLIAGTTLR
jgi:hypothetical protein